MLYPLPRFPLFTVSDFQCGKDYSSYTVRLQGKWMNRREHLEPRRWKASYTKHKRAFLLISVFKRQKKTHFLKCSLEILCFEVVKEFWMWDKGETLAWREDNSLFLQGLGLNCRECWHSAQVQLPRPQHLLEKVELETCALHSLLIISLPASTIVHVLWHSQSLHLGFAQDSVDKLDDECGKLLPERVWLELHLKLLTKDSSVVFCWSLCPSSGRSHSAEGCTTWSRDAPLTGDSLSGWQYLLLDYISSCFDMMKLRISSMRSFHSVSLPAFALFFQQQRLACRHFKLNIIQARNSANHSRSTPPQFAGIADRYEMFHLYNPQHTCSHSRWVSGDFHALKGSMEWQIGHVCESENTVRPFLCADRECQDLCLPTSIYHGLVCSKMLLFFINSFICKRQSLHAVFAAASLGLPG